MSTNLSSELLQKLWEIAQATHVAMHTDDGMPQPFKDQVILLLMQHASDANADTVWAAVLLAAATNDPKPLQTLADFHRVTRVEGDATSGY
jgi:hypothetical protein